MGCKTTLQTAAKGIIALFVEALRHGNGNTSRLDHRPGPATQPEDVRVYGIDPAVARSRCRRLAQDGGHRSRSDPSVAIPDGLTAFDCDAVNHPVAGKPVVTAWVRRNGIGADPDIPSVQRPGQYAVH